LEGVERDTDRQVDGELDRAGMKPERLERRLPALDEEAEVLEGAQQAEVGDQAHHQPASPMLRLRAHGEGAGPVDDGGARDQEQEPGVDPPIEDVAGDQQEDVLRLALA
jgi:hypothetical protein